MTSIILQNFLEQSRIYSFEAAFVVVQINAGTPFTKARPNLVAYKLLI
jgi:hypothetical protein